MEDHAVFEREDSVVKPLYTVLPNRLSRENYDFAGWKLSSSSGTSTFAEGQKMSFTGGTAWVRLRGGQTITAEGLPADCSYTVEQTADSDFTTTLVELTQGTITASGTESKEFVNTRKTGSLTISNTVKDSTGAADNAPEFAYTVTLSDKSINATYGNADNAVTFANGVATVRVKSGTPKTIHGLPTSVGYTVTQLYTPAYDTVRQGDTGTITSEPITASFTNTLLGGTATLRVRKQVTGAGYDGDENFEFVLSKGGVTSGDIMPMSMLATAKNDEEATFAIRFEAPGTYYYYITERAASGTTGTPGMKYSTSMRWARVDVVRNAIPTQGQPSLTASVAYGVTKEEASKAAASDSATIVNEYVHPALTVAFESNGGGRIASQTVAYGKTATKPADPTSDGWAFRGWYRDKALKNAYDFGTAVTQNLTLYAKWQINSYTVAFNSNGGSAVAAQKVTYGNVATAPKAPTRAGYAFKGWFTDAKLTKAYDFKTKVTSNLTLYAKWQANTYTVTLNSNGGSAVAAQKVNYGGKATSKRSTRYGHDFLGWYSDAKLTKAYNFNTKVTKNITLYAKWRAHVPSITYATHVQTYGWQDEVTNGAMAGTTGKAKRLEGIYLKLSNLPYKGSIQYRTHIQTFGWEKGWKADGQTSGTTGKAKRLEAIEIRLTGELSKHYDVYYRVHAQTHGWLGWAKNGQKAGTAGYAKRLEGIQVVLVAKGSKAPGATFKGITQWKASRYITIYGDN